MINISDASIRKIILHKIGNEQDAEATVYSKKELQIEENIKEVLLDYFLSPFKSEEYFHLYHDDNLESNIVYSSANALFEDDSTFHNQSIKLADHLKSISTNNNIKKGEFYTVIFDHCNIDGEEVEVIGLFKSENRDSFLKVYSTEESFAIQCEEGINISKLDKGCLIFNTEKDNGYIVTAIDNTNKSTNAQFWKDDFLKIKTREDNYYHTQNVMSFCKSFVKEQLPEEYDISKADQAFMLNKSVDILKEKESFEFNEFVEEVFEHPEIVESVKQYKNDFEQQSNVQLSEEFDISSQAVKKQARIMKSVIKLDKNFHIYVHGKRQYIQKGYDEEKGLNFYQIYFKEEN
jgi:37-kD nucleoid-associated bacterial protein